MYMYFISYTNCNIDIFKKYCKMIKNETLFIIEYAKSNKILIFKLFNKNSHMDNIEFYL